MDDLLHRYRLALALIPEPNAAGDLFMAARDEADLRRRAARWRQQAGLEPAPEPACLPELTPEQREHALHLARRGHVHRRVKSWLAGLTAVVVLAGSGYLLYESARPRLDVDPAFAEAPLSRARGPGELRLSVYDVDYDRQTATLSVWWELTGTGASDRARRLKPELHLSRSDWVEQSSTRFYSTSPERLLAVSRFRVTRLQQLFRMRVEEGRTDEDDFQVIIPIPPRLDRR